MIKLSQEQIDAKIQFIEDYAGAHNAASASAVDANANVTTKNIATLYAEMWKDFTIQVNRGKVQKHITDLFGPELAAQYLVDLENHTIYTHDESALTPYCVSVSLYPFLDRGMLDLGGESGAPKHLESYIGSFGNLMFAISAQFAGAVASVEFLPYFDYFARKDYGDDYLDNPHIRELMEQKFQHVVYVLNQPATARGFQSIFWNISIFDKHFFESLFGDFYFPDGTQMKWETIDKLQKFFVGWFREERKKALLTFPVITLSALTEGETWKDKDYLDWAAKEYSEGSEFFIYTSPTVDSLASCCRLRNALQENQFSYSLGAGGVMTGSKNVITLNLNNIVQSGQKIAEVIDRVHKYQVAHDAMFHWYFDNNLLTVYSAGYISLEKQFLTLGINGVVEAAEYLGYEISNNDPYKSWLKGTLGLFKDKNKEAGATYGVRFNTECVPAENLGVKNSKWDAKAGYLVNRECYNSYFYKVEDASLSVFDKMKLHGGEILDNLDGGSALHFNNDERLSEVQYKLLFNALAITGSNYFAENVPKTICDDCGYIHPNNVDKCPRCGSGNIGKATRVIGYLKRVDNFSKARQEEATRRYYHKAATE